MQSSGKHYLTGNRTDETTQLIGRSKAERQLDSIFNKQTKFLRKQKLENISCKKYVSNKDSAVCFPTSNKKLKTEEKQISEKASKHSATSKSPLDALSELVFKHIENNAKFPRAVELVGKLWNVYISTTNKAAFMYAIDKIVNSDCCICSPEGRKQVIKLFEDVALPMARKNVNNHAENNLENLSANVEKGKGALQTNERCNIPENECVYFTSEELEFLNVISIRGIYHNKLFTDDAYQFNKSMTFLKNVFEELQNEHRNKLNLITEEKEELESIFLNENNEERRGEKSEIISESNNNEVSTEAEEKGEEPRKLCYFENVLAEEEEEENQCFSKEKAEYFEGKAEEMQFKRSVNKQGEEETMNQDVKEENKLTNDLNNILSVDVLLAWKVPSNQELSELRRRLFFDTLKTIFQMKNVMWAISSVNFFFQNVYINRHIFDANEIDQISYWQSEIKGNTKTSKSFDVYKIGESAVPVKDGREERIISTHGSYIWSAKQTGV